MKKFIAFLMLMVIAVSAFTSCTDKNPGEQTDKRKPYITLSQKNFFFEDVGESGTLTYEIGPKEYESDSVDWSSSDENVATCTDGVISAVGYGICVIKATTESGASTSCVVTVENPHQDIFLSAEDQLFSDIGQTVNIVATDVFGNDITEELSWVTSNRNVATCFYGEVTTTGFGICTVKAVAKNGTTVYCFIRVEDPYAPSLTLTKNNIELLKVGDSVPLEAVSSNENVQIRWMSSDSDVATYENGKIVARGEGVCAILAMSDNGLVATAAVTVGEKKAAESIEGRLMFEIRGLPTTVKYVDRQTGEIASEMIVLSCEIEYEIVEEDYMLCTLKYNCVKTFDRLGSEGKNFVALSASMYSKNKNESMLDSTALSHEHTVGDSFVVELPQFMVALYPDKVRDDLYMDIIQITER